jgi:hypothetical protein
MFAISPANIATVSTIMISRDGNAGAIMKLNIKHGPGMSDFNV